MSPFQNKIMLYISINVTTYTQITNQQLLFYSITIKIVHKSYVTFCYSQKNQEYNIVKRLLILIGVLGIYLSSASIDVKADVAGLIPCKDSTSFNKRLESSVKKLNNRLSKYTTGTPPALALEAQITKTQTRFENYGKAGLLCGTDGLPHLIADGRWTRAGDFIFPGLLFIYITGWIGWVGRGYLKAISIMNKPTEKEIILDVPLALKFSVSGFTWPLAAWQEFTSGNLIETEDNITISPR